MKIVMYCDKYLYRKLYMAFPKYDENDNIIGSLFSEEEFDNFHVLDRDYINLTLNPVDGIKDIYFLLIQKSWYKDMACINICKYFKMLHPESKIIFYFDEDYSYHRYLCNKIVSEQLGYIARSTEELELILQSRFEKRQDEYLLPKLKKKTIKKLKTQFLNS